MPQRPLRLTFGPSRSGLFHGQFAGSGFRGRISEAWPHISAPGAFMLGGTRTGNAGRPKKIPGMEQNLGRNKTWDETNTKKKHKKHNSTKDSNNSRSLRIQKRLRKREAVCSRGLKVFGKERVPRRLLCRRRG